MREISYKAIYHGKTYNVSTRTPKFIRSNRYKGWWKSQGYVNRLVTEHPFCDCRGYVREHRLVMEEHLGRFLEPYEFIHHKDQNRSNNELSNLQLRGGQDIHAKQHLIGKRNLHGQFLCKEPIFNELKFRLYNSDTGLTNVYSLNQLIATTFRRGCFKFRGRFTGLKDKNGKEIYEGDIVKTDEADWIAKVIYNYDGFLCINNEGGFSTQCNWKNFEVIGNIYENPELLKGEQ